MEDNLNIKYCIQKRMKELKDVNDNILSSIMVIILDFMRKRMTSNNGIEFATKTYGKAKMFGIYGEKVNIFNGGYLLCTMILDSEKRIRIFYDNRVKEDEINSFIIDMIDSV